MTCLYYSHWVRKWQDYYYSSHSWMQRRGERHKSQTQLCEQLQFLRFDWCQTCVHGKALTEENLLWIIFITEETKYPRSSFFSTLQCLVSLRKNMKLSVEKAKLDWLLSASSHSPKCSRFHISPHYPGCWSLFYPVLASGCSSDLNGTIQGYKQSVWSLYYAMMRWLLRSLMSAGGTRSFLTGVDDRVDRLPLGLNKSDTKNTCKGKRATTFNISINCKVAHSKSQSVLLSWTTRKQEFVYKGRYLKDFIKHNKCAVKIF